MAGIDEGESNHARPWRAGIPSLGAVATAPVLLLLSHPAIDAATPVDAYGFAREGGPLAALHPDAPVGLAARWHGRLASLVARFGAQHVAHSVAAVFLDPWPSACTWRGEAPGSRLHSLELATRAADRDALLVIVGGADAWLAHAPIAALPPTRRCTARHSGAEDLDAAALGADTWEVLGARIAVHAWL